METLFFILIIVILIIGLFFMNRDNKENMTMGDEAIDDFRLENSFRRDQIDYYRKKNSGIHTNCEESNFVKLANNNSKLKEVKVCDFFTGKNIKENFDSSKINSMEASKYVEEIDQCRDLNNSLKRNLGPKSTIEDIKNELMQIPDQFAFNKTDEEQIGEEDKGCGYCWDGPGFGEILYGDSLGPYKNVKTGSVCENWVKPGDLRRGGGLNLMNNKWKSEDDATTMKFGGNQGVVTDAIKLHEQKICSEVTGCGDLDGEKNICGWCFMGRKGDGKGEGMVAMKDADGNIIGETKYKDDYCPWPGEVKGDGKPDPDKWTGPNDTSKWLIKAAKDGDGLTESQVYDLDLKLQKDLKNKENAKKNDDTLDVSTRNLAKKAMYYIENKIRYISSFGTADEYVATIYNKPCKKCHWQTNELGDAANNKFLYKCGNGVPKLDGDGKNVFFLHNYSGLSSDQKIIIKGMYETHEFLKKCQTDMSIFGNKIDISSQDGKDIMEFCNSMQEFLDEDGHKKLKEIFMKLDLSKDNIGCMENCNLTNDNGGYNNITGDGTKWKINDNLITPTPTCKPLVTSEIKDIFGYDEYNKFNKQGTRVFAKTRSAKIIERIKNTNTFKIKYDDDNTLDDILGSEIRLKVKNSNFAPNIIAEILMDGKSFGHNSLGDRIKEIWRIFIKIGEDLRPELFSGDFSLSKSPQKTNVMDSNNPLNTYTNLNNKSGNIDKALKYEIDVLNGEPQLVPDGKGGEEERQSWRETSLNGGISGSRLLIDISQCETLNKNFPCFKNWFGKKDVTGKLPYQDGYDPSKPLGHEDACYDELWHTQTKKDFTGEGGFGVIETDTKSCYLMNGAKSGIPSFKNAMDRTFLSDGVSHSLKKYTIDVMNKLPITSVKKDIENIRITADTSHQYEAIYADGDITDDMKKTQILNSAKVATNACYGELYKFEDKEIGNSTDNDEKMLPYSCQNRFRNEKYNFPRPKDCVDHFWKTRTEGNQPVYKHQTHGIDGNWEDRSSWNLGKDYHVLNPDFDKVWGNMNIPAKNWQDQINYNATNHRLARFLEENVAFLNKFKNKTTKHTASNYDKYLIKKRLIYEYINEDEDKIWKYLKPDETVTDADIIKKVMKETEYPWVKMCWGDFKDALKFEFKKGINIVTENGDGTLNLEKAPKLKAIIDGDETKKARMVIKTKDNYEYSLKYGRRNKGGRIEFDHPKIPSSITEKLYNKTWFPFWRFFNKMDGGGLKYYEKAEFLANEKKQLDIRQSRDVSRRNYMNAAERGR